MRQRIAYPLDHRLVEFGLGTGDFQPDVLADLLRDVAHHALELVEGGADLDHAQLQRGITDVLDEPVEQGGRLQQFGLATACGGQIDAGAGDDQFADQVDVLIELFRIDADQRGLARVLVP